MRRRSSRGAGPERGLTQMSGEDPSAEGVFCSVRRAHTHAHLPMTSTRKWSAKRVTFPRDWRQKEPPRNSAAAAVGLRRGWEDGRSSRYSGRAPDAPTTGTVGRDLLKGKAAVVAHAADDAGASARGEDLTRGPGCVDDSLFGGHALPHRRMGTFTGD
ncbi:unnamed protein product, partial [Ixodes persulcatus]